MTGEDAQAPAGNAWLSVLEAATIGVGVSAAQAFLWTVDVAAAADSLGFARVWVAEHHSTPDIGSSSPAVLIAHLAARLSTVRVGSGGVMLRNHSSLLVAEQFSTLNALYPGRIDLGIGRGKGGPALAAHALGHPEEPDDATGFVSQLDDVLGLLGVRPPADDRYVGVTLAPPVESPPTVHLLGSSVGSARVAAARGLPYAYANHLSPEATEEAIRTYRDGFEPQYPGAVPHAIATMLVVGSATQEDAERLAVSALALRLRRRQGGAAGPDAAGTDAAGTDAADPRLSDEELTSLAAVFSNGSLVAGDPATLRAQLSGFRDRVDADEVMICCPLYGGADRVRSLYAAAGLGWSG